MKYFTTALLSLLLIVGCATTDIKPITQQLNDFSEVVVSIEIHSRGSLFSTGSGVIIDSFQDKNKYNTAVLTARHNINDLPFESKIYVVVEGLQIPCHLVFAHLSMDAAVLVIETTGKHTGALMDTSPLTPLEEVYTGGFPMGFELLVSEGILNYSIAKDLGQIPKTLWLCTAPTFPGNSGGGIFDKDSRKLIGLSVAVGSRPGPHGGTVVPHIHIFIPINVLDEWIDEVNHERQKL